MGLDGYFEVWYGIWYVGILRMEDKLEYQESEGA